MSDETRGIYRKYEVRKINDPEGRHIDCHYFVLDLECDVYAEAALRAYADACEAKYPQLAADIRRGIRRGDVA